MAVLTLSLKSSLSCSQAYYLHQNKVFSENKTIEDLIYKIEFLIPSLPIILKWLWEGTDIMYLRIYLQKLSLECYDYHYCYTHFDYRFILPL